MAELQKEWLFVRYDGDKNGEASFEAGVNEDIDRAIDISFRAEGSDKQTIRTVKQEGKREVFSGADGVFYDANGDRFLGLKQKYKEQ